LKEGKRNASWFVFGAVIIIFSSLLAILFARVIDIRPDIVILLREVGLVYLSFDVLFLLLAEKPKVKKAK
jgi:threonine/homoserine/homoserine lactone efflux protein